MELYDKLSQEINRLITTRYSTSFGLSSTLFPITMRTHIYSIYGLVRIADEIVDTYRGSDAPLLLDELEADCYRCLKNGYSANPVVHAFGITARKYGIESTVIRAFFASMRMDTTTFDNTRANFDRYVYGSAEAVGLMCLYVFVDGDSKEFKRLAGGAQALGAAYQKINFLRDLAADADELKRWYFPDSSYETFDNAAKKVMTKEIETDIATARVALKQLPASSRRAVNLSLTYYEMLLKKLETTTPDELKKRRLRVSNYVKIALYAKARVSS